MRKTGGVSASRGITIGVLTSGGDAPGMNSAVRAVVRAALHFGAGVHAVLDGFQGAVDGGDRIRALGWDDVSGIQHLGGTILGTARCPAFRERDGLRRAAAHLARRGIDRLVVIGGDGSLAGADDLAREWPSLIDELVTAGELDAATAAAHPALLVTGVVGSIDNDMVGTDMTVGADSALHRICEAIDALASTAASHQRAFVVEVMGRRCGYLALTAALAGGCDYALIPEAPPGEDWADDMVSALRRGRALGRRDSIVLVAEGARDRRGVPITAEQVRSELQTRLGEDTRLTILGHVQRGGRPSAFDRNLATRMGYAAVEGLMTATPTEGPSLVGLRHNRIRRAPLMRAVTRNRSVNALLDRGEYAAALAARGENHAALFELLKAMTRPEPVSVAATGRRIGILHAGGLAPGMNPAVRAAVGIGHRRGHTMLGVQGGFAGLPAGDVHELDLASVEGWAARGGAELGSRRGVIAPRHLDDLARAVQRHRLDGLLVIGGFDAYESALTLTRAREQHPALGLPVVCVPATIDNNLPGTELTIGSDTALGEIVTQVDRIKQSAMAARRVFVIETMGRQCGYLALMAAMAAGAEQVYLPEEGAGLGRIAAEVDRMGRRFDAGHRLHVVLRSEGADPHWTTDVMAQVFAADAGARYDVRTIVLGHTQQGGDPSPFDRILATRLAARAVEEVTARLEGAAGSPGDPAVMVGLRRGEIVARPLTDMDTLVDWATRRPVEQWWLGLAPIARTLADAST